MLIQNEACSRLAELFNSPAFISYREEILVNHSLIGLLDINSKEWKLQYFRMVVHQQLLKNMSLDNEIVNDFIVLKGMSFNTYDIYESYGDRLTADIDLLVKDLEKFSQYLKSLSFFLVANHVWKGNDYKRVFSKQISGIEVVVELHTRLFYHSSFNQFRLIRSKDGYFVLGLEDLLVHLVGHLAFQHTFLKVHWLLDIHLLQEKYKSTLDYDRVNFLLDKLELHRSWSMTQQFISVCFLGIKPRFFKSFIYDLNFLFLPERFKFKYYIIKHLTKDRFLTSINYNIYWLLQKGWKK